MSSSNFTSEPMPTARRRTEPEQLNQQCHCNPESDDREHELDKQVVGWEVDKEDEVVELKRLRGQPGQSLSAGSLLRIPFLQCRCTRALRALCTSKARSSTTRPRRVKVRLRVRAPLASFYVYFIIMFSMTIYVYTLQHTKPANPYVECDIYTHIYQSPRPQAAADSLPG